MSLDELELALQASFDDATLAVYADELMARGDPRGEMIALELAAPTPVGQVRWRELRRAWLGELVGTCDVRRGFVEQALSFDEEDAPAKLAQLRACAGPYVRRLRLHGDDLAPQVRLVAASSWPWLVDLELAGWDEHPLPAELVERLVAATPRLAKLSLLGVRVLDAFPHPAVTSLQLKGAEAFPALFEEGGPRMQAVAHLAIELEVPAPGAPNLPPLRSVDVTQWDERRVSPYELLDALPLEQLERLVLPSLRDADDAARAQAVLDRAPRLAAVRIAAAYEIHGDHAATLRHPAARIELPVTRPWPPLDEVWRDMLEVRAGPVVATELSLRTCIRGIDGRFDTLDEDVRAAWATLWRVARAGGGPIATSVLLAALADERNGGIPRWNDVRARLLRERARLPAVAELRRYLAG